MTEKQTLRRTALKAICAMTLAQIDGLSHISDPGNKWNLIKCKARTSTIRVLKRLGLLEAVEGNDLRAQRLTPLGYQVANELGLLSRFVVWVEEINFDLDVAARVNALIEESRALTTQAVEVGALVDVVVCGDVHLATGRVDEVITESGEQYAHVEGFGFTWAGNCRKVENGTAQTAVIETTIHAA